MSPFGALIARSELIAWDTNTGVASLMWAPDTPPYIYERRAEWVVLGLSLTIRSALLAMLVASGLRGVPYDTSNLLPTPSCDARVPLLAGRHADVGALSRLAVWDSAFFVRIAQCGYEYEQIHAFFPLLPLLLRLTSFGGDTWQSPEMDTSRLILTGLLFSVLASAATCVLLYRLTKRMFADDQIAALSALLFACNPASVFHSAVYSESVFALLSFAAMYIVAEAPSASAVLFGLSTAARSNGIVSSIFVGHDGLRRLGSLRAKHRTGAALIILQTALGGALVILPLVAFQWHGFREYCHGPPEQLPAWCSVAVPYLYGHVQSHYWGVGFLRYFRIEQVPNFLLAAPMLALSFWGCATFVREHGLPATLHSLFLPGTPLQGWKQRAMSHSDTFPPAAAVYIAHWGFLAVFALLLMHVQVATRLLSTCPPLYWFAAQLCRDQRRAPLVWMYWLTYCALGYVLFPRFYPWT